MSEEVKMPQMGESIAEGTIVRWLKQVGDSVKRDEPLFEISTDKVDAEIPSPAAGTLTGDVGTLRLDMDKRLDLVLPGSVPHPRTPADAADRPLTEAARHAR